MKFECKWEVWEHGKPEDDSRSLDDPHKIASGIIVKEGPDAKTLEAEWLKLAKQAWPELTATTTREYIFRASPQ